MAFFKFRIDGKFRGNSCINTFHYLSDSSTTGSIQAAVDYIRQMYVNYLQSRLADDYSFDTITVTNMELAELMGVAYTPTSGAFAGSSVGDLLPPANAILIEWRTGTLKPNRGRSYISGWNNTASGTGGGVNSAAITDLTNWCNQMDAFTAGDGSQWAMHVYSPTLSVPPAVVSNQITSFTIKEEWSGQRSRRVGRGS